MDVRVQPDPAALLELVGPLLRADRVRHTVLLTVLDGLCRAPLPGQSPPVLLSVHDGGDVVGAALRTPPHGLICSAVPQSAIEVVLTALAEHDPDLPGFTGPIDVVGALVAACGRPVVDDTRLRLFALESLVDPVGVPGAARAMTAADVELVAQRLLDFADEAGTSPVTDPFGTVRQWAAVGAHPVVWEDGGAVVALARASPSVAGMSRVGPVHTPPAHRGHGYGAAVTAAAVTAALAAGAQDVVLFTDLANPTSNRLYPRLGFTPVEDHREVRLAP